MQRPPNSFFGRVVVRWFPAAQTARLHPGV